LLLFLKKLESTHIANTCTPYWQCFDATQGLVGFIKVQQIPKPITNTTTTTTITTTTTTTTTTAALSNDQLKLMLYSDAQCNTKMSEWQATCDVCDGAPSHLRAECLQVPVARANRLMHANSLLSLLLIALIVVVY
jgi:hypothetical protein